MLPAIKGRREVFLSRDLSLAPLLTRRRNNHRFIGDSLKIPACCVEFYLVQSEQAAERGFDSRGLIRIPKSLKATLSATRWPDISTEELWTTSPVVTTVEKLVSWLGS